MQSIISCKIKDLNLLLFKEDKLSNSVISNKNLSFEEGKFLQSITIKNCIGDNKLVFDVGSYIGTTSEIWLKNGCTTYSFEANYLNFTCLKNNLSRWKHKSILFNQIVGDGDYYKSFDMSQSSNLGSNFYLKNKKGLRSIKLDDFCYLDRVDLIKLDIEGMELSALKNADNFIKKFKPVIVMEICEKSLRRNNIRRSSIFSFLESYNYNLKDVLKYNDYVFSVL
jgi:FkbM family methyltransferase